MTHLVIRGPRGVGKSTLIQKLLREANRPLSGFCTKKYPSEGADITYIFPAAQPVEERELSPDRMVGSCCQGRKLEAYPEAFEKYGVEYLQNPKEDSILVMDELGFMEKDALNFQQEVLKALEGEVQVLAAVKNKPSAFLDQICNHPKVKVFEISEENRDALLDEMKEFLV